MSAKAGEINRRREIKGINLSLAHDVLRRVHRYLDPPGGCQTFIDHPMPSNRKAVTVGIVLEHRFAFYYWIKCKQDLRYDSSTHRWIPDQEFVPPDLVTLDWHNDIGGECDIIQDELRRLDQRNEAEVGLFCWAGLRSLNDGHVFPAVWLNAIGDVYAIVKQREWGQDREEVADRYGKKHKIFYCRNPAKFLKERSKKDCSPGLIWDIDLDFFTRFSKVAERGCCPALSDDKIARFWDPEQEWVREILWNLEAITIALEPEYTGGLSKSLHILGQWEKAFFAKPLFEKHCSWRPLLG
ncbi:MAG: hypothetical protein NTX87_05760 [Planctomycetota bacterium]|nr:hypothetical protein [Planctomycetota bacterium]